MLVHSVLTNVNRCFRF